MKKKSGIKVHTNIHEDEDLPSDIRYNSAATNNRFMLKSSIYYNGDILAIDRANIDDAIFEELPQRDVIYVSKMKQNLNYEILRNNYFFGCRKHTPTDVTADGCCGKRRCARQKAIPARV